MNQIGETENIQIKEDSDLYENIYAMTKRYGKFNQNYSNDNKNFDINIKEDNNLNKENFNSKNKSLKSN